ncbi:hypothetical protein LV779_34585 [Streptomyces thinghirensis]|nr:hypothetical protein [Streptomyces thinghirensis]
MEVIEPHAAEDAYTVKAKYDPALFDAATVDRLLRQYAHLLESAPATDPNRPLDDCSAASPQELLPSRWSGTTPPSPSPSRASTSCSLSRRPAPGRGRARRGHRVRDVRAPRRAHRGARRAAARDRRGAGPPRRRAPGTLRRPRRRPARHAARRGRLYIPSTRTTRASGSPTSSTTPRPPCCSPTPRCAHGPADLDRPGQRLLVLDDPGADPAAEEPGEGAAPGAEDPAYVIYTLRQHGPAQGRRGAPPRAHQLPVRDGEAAGLGAADRVLAVTTHSFDIAALELFLPLVTGAECHLSDPATARSGERLAALIARVRPPADLRRPPRRGRCCCTRGWTNVKACVCCAAARRCPRRSPSAHPRTRGRGVEPRSNPTETTVWSTVARCGGGPPRHHRAPHRQHPDPHPRQERRPAPSACPASRVHRGRRLALSGYPCNKPGTHRRTVPRRPRRTGRRAVSHRRYGTAPADGAIECLGRIDSQVKGGRLPRRAERSRARPDPAPRRARVRRRHQGRAGDRRHLARRLLDRNGRHRARADRAPALHPARVHGAPAFVLPVEGLPRDSERQGVDRLALARRPITLPDEPAERRALLGNLLTGLWGGRATSSPRGGTYSA